MNKNFHLYVIIAVLVAILVTTNITGVHVSTVRGDLADVQAELTARAEASAEAPAEVEPEATKAPQAEAEPDEPALVDAFTPYESEGGIPFSGTVWNADVAPDEIEVLTAGPLTVAGVSLPGGEKRGSVLILLPDTKVVSYEVTGLVAGANWHASYRPTKVDEATWRSLINDRVIAMQQAPNCHPGTGCITIDVLVIDSTGVVAQWTVSK